MYNVPDWYHSLTHSHTHASSGFSLTPLRCPCSSPSARGVSSGGSKLAGESRGATSWRGARGLSGAPTVRAPHRAQALGDLVHSRPRHGRSLGHGVERWFAKRKRCETREAESTKLSKLGLRQLTFLGSRTYRVHCIVLAPDSDRHKRHHSRSQLSRSKDALNVSTRAALLFLARTRSRRQPGCRRRAS